MNNFRDIPQIARLTEQQRLDIEIVGNVLPFKVNNYVVDQLIDWDKVPNDPIFALTFPQRDMLSAEHYGETAIMMSALVVLGLVFRPKHRVILGLTWISLGLFMLYVFNAWLLFAHARS
ncbi:MAG: hypothetical protein PHW66_05825 [Gallionella sp.]|nr:hypothetical protein [Gallionella sp.]